MMINKLIVLGGLVMVTSLAMKRWTKNLQKYLVDKL